MRASWKTQTLAIVVAVAVCSLVFLVIAPFRHVFALAFAGVLLAVAWCSAAELVNVRRVLPHPAVVVAVGLAVAGLSALFGSWVGTLLVEQFQNLGGRLNEAYEVGRGLMSSSEAGRSLGRHLPDFQDGQASGAVISRIWAAVSAGFGAMGDLLIIFFVGLFVALNPRPYVHGTLHLLPRVWRPRVSEVTDHMGHALRRWLLARAVLMLLVGVAFGVGLWALGVPLALPLAVIAGLLEFVPYVGPASAVVPALAVAFMESPRQAFYVGLLYLLTQLVESYVAEPLIEGKTLSLPPALIILFQVVCGLWLGLLGVVIATPLLVVIMVAVQTLYVRDVLRDPIRVAGQRRRDQKSGFSGTPAPGST